MHLRHVLIGVFAPLALVAGPVGDASAFAQFAPGADTPEATVQAWLLEETSSDFPVNYSLSWVDLNGDGRAEAIVYLTGSGMCGSGGCRMYVLELQQSDFTVRASTTVTRPPIYVLEARSNGWQDLAVTVCGGGITRCYQTRLTFNGSAYPPNPTTTPRVRNLGLPRVILVPELGTHVLRP
jgi:hypothetical protein